MHFSGKFRLTSLIEKEHTLLCCAFVGLLQCSQGSENALKEMAKRTLVVLL